VSQRTGSTDEPASFHSLFVSALIGFGSLPREWTDTSVITRGGQTI
jgi:hypothetical protein